MSEETTESDEEKIQVEKEKLKKVLKLAAIGLTDHEAEFSFDSHSEYTTAEMDVQRLRRRL